MVNIKYQDDDWQFPVDSCVPPEPDDDDDED